MLFVFLFLLENDRNFQLIKEMPIKIKVSIMKYGTQKLKIIHIAMPQKYLPLIFWCIITPYSFPCIFVCVCVCVCSRSRMRMHTCMCVSKCMGKFYVCVTKIRLNLRYSFSLNFISRVISTSALIDLPLPFSNSLLFL